MTSLLVKHVEHTMGYQKSTKDIHTREKDGDQSQDISCVGFPSHLQNPADDDDTANRVCNSHQRGVEGMGNRPDHIPADDA